MEDWGQPLENNESSIPTHSITERKIPLINIESSRFGNYSLEKPKKEVPVIFEKKSFNTCIPKKQIHYQRNELSQRAFKQEPTIIPQQIIENSIEKKSTEKKAKRDPYDPKPQYNPEYEELFKSADIIEALKPPLWTLKPEALNIEIAQYSINQFGDFIEF